MLYLQKGPRPGPTAQKNTTLGGLSCKFRERQSTRPSTSAVAAASMSTPSGNSNGGGASSALYDLYGPNVRALLLLRLPRPTLSISRFRCDMKGNLSLIRAELLRYWKRSYFFVLCCSVSGLFLIPAVWQNWVLQPDLQVVSATNEYVNLIAWKYSSRSFAKIETGDVALHHG